MEPFRYHVFICDQPKPEKVPGCSASGSAATIAALRAELAKRNLNDDVQVTTCGSLGLCERGPNMVVYPEGVWYSRVTPADVPEIVESHFVEGIPVSRLVNADAASLKGEIQLNRGKYLASLKAKDQAGMLPDELAERIRAFQDSRAILSAVELDLFAHVGGGATATDVARKAGTDPRATEMLLGAMAALGLLEKRNGRFVNTAISARFLVPGGKDDARAATRHYLSTWDRWSRLTEAVRSGTALAHVELAERDPERWTRPFIAAMHHRAALAAPMLVRSVGTAGVKRMLDVGGGSGVFAIAFAAASPELTAEVFDLPTVLPLTREYVAAAGLEGRVGLRSGDLRTDDFGSGWDVILLSAVCHMLGEEENRDLIRRCAAALAPKGRLVVSDFLLNEEGTGPKSAALFSLNMLVATPRGASYTESAYTGWMREAGLGSIRKVTLPGPADLVIGMS
jgi:(2Fe-2S) ferredoxin/SAM-dependent methyltransferase